MIRPIAVIAILSGSAEADPLVLRADALATTASPAGLVTLSADGDLGTTMSAEAAVWTGSETTNVLVIALRAHTKNRRASVRLGRFVEALGGLRPVQLDGGSVRVRLPHRFDIETFGGVPVAPETARSWDWIVGGRIARLIGDAGSIGVAYAEQRDAGRLAFEEVALDAGVAIGKRDDLGARVAYDLANPAVAEATLIASHRWTALRADLYAGYRAASHLLPATSLFSVLGDTPAGRGGVALAWRAAPRLDVGADLGVRRAGDDTSPAAVVRAKLRLDARGASALSGEVRRDPEWTGIRGAARIALAHDTFTSCELEVVRPDHDRGRGSLWPWLLVAAGYDDGTWSAAVAGEASASATDRRRLDVLLQVGRRWSAP